MGRPKSVLWVDDEVESLGAHVLFLEEHGYAVEISADGTQALKLLAARGCFDVILLDYLLPPPYNGLTLMKEIKDQCFDSSAFILFTGWGLDPEVGVEALKAGAYRYLAKPFNWEELAILIQSIVEIRQTRETLAQTSREKAWLESLLEVSQSVNSILELDTVLQLILDEMKRVVIYDSATIQRITDQGLKIVAGKGFPDQNQQIGRVFPPSEEYPNYRVWKSRQPMIEPDRQTTRHPSQSMGWMGVPLIFHDQAIGVITLDSRTPGFYDNDDARMAMVFATRRPSLLRTPASSPRRNANSVNWTSYIAHRP